MAKLFNNKEKKIKPTVEELIQQFSDKHRTRKEYIFENETSYKNKNCKFIYGMLFCVILFVPILIFSIYEQVEFIKLGLEIHNMTISVIMNIIMLPLTLFILKTLHTVILLGYSSIFNIKFHEAFLEYKGLFTKKTINYTDIFKISYIEVVLSGRGGTTVIYVLELNLNNGKKVKLNCNTLDKNDYQEFIDNIEVCTNLHKINSTKGLLTFS